MNSCGSTAFQACTIITRSYLPQARVLYQSFCRIHPDIPFSALVYDSPAAEIHEAFDVFDLNDIGLPAGEEKRMPMLYEAYELATAVKPWYFRRLLERNRCPLLYLDPDIEIFSPLDRLAGLAAEHCLVITPHTTRPMSRDNVHPNETAILASGAYNLGFIGLNPDCFEFLTWWSERLLREAMVDLANMRFTDQRWIDFVPGYFDTCILKDETCNVAYWNADSRPVTWTGSRYEVNGRPLCFFHFSGFAPEKPHLLSKHQGPNPRTRLSEHPALARLCREYTDKLEKAGYNEFSKLPYVFDTAPNGLKITREMRLAYRAALRKHEEAGATEPPEAFSDPAKFVRWLNEPLYPRRSPKLTRYFWAIHANRSDLRAIFPDLLGADKDPYYDWLQTQGRREFLIPDELFPKIQPTVTTSAGPAQKDALSPGVILTGYFRAEVGTGESGRLMSLAVKASGEKQFSWLWSDTRSRQNHPWEEEQGAAPNYDTNIICINADQLPAFAHEVGPEFFENRYNIGFWFWELEVFPPQMHRAFNYLHEVWVTSEFVRDAVAKVSPIPVFIVPHPMDVTVPTSPSLSRAALNLPDGFLFLFSFDFFSVVERKNPVGLIEAFKRAFAPGEGPVLVIRSINGDRSLAELERLYFARGDRSDIIIRDGYLTGEQRNAFTAACDCYVSLHRAEGFGLTIAEAMLVGKPAIATRYSGNLAFMDDSNSFLCGYELRRVGSGFKPYPPDARWATADVAEAARLMRFVYENPDEARRRGERGRADVSATQSPENVARIIKTRMTELRKKPPLPRPVLPSHLQTEEVVDIQKRIEDGVDVRRVVPSLATWILQGPRRAMKQFVRAYHHYHRELGLSALQSFRKVHSQWVHDRDSTHRRMRAHEEDIQTLKEELQQARDDLAALREELNSRDAGTSVSEAETFEEIPEVPGVPKSKRQSQRVERGAPQASQSR